MSDRELDGVEPTALTCAQVEERDLEAAYLARRLTGEEATAYEAHLFGCDRCWSRLQTALSVAAVAPRPRPAGRRMPAHRSRWRLPLAAAAALAVVLAGGWWVAGRRAAPEPLRGPGDSLVVQARTKPSGIAVRFGPVAGADRYRVRVFSEAGILMAEREVGDTTVDVALESGVEAVLIQVTALDPLSETVASSRLVRLDRSAPPPPQ